MQKKRKDFNPEHSSTFAKALAKMNVPEDYEGIPVESILYFGTVDYKILKRQDHHLFQSQLKHPLKNHDEHPIVQKLLFLSIENS